MRELYEGGLPIQRIANRYHVARGTIRNYAKAGGWVKPEIEIADAPDADTDASAAPGNPEVGWQVAILEDGIDPRVALVKGHQREWKEIEAIRKLALKAFKDPAFKPEDADDKWNATERLKYAGRLFSVYNTASNALMVAQEGERRAHGFDYRDQRKAANAEAQDQTRRAELMTEIAGLIEIITSKDEEPENIEGDYHEHEGAALA